MPRFKIQWVGDKKYEADNYTEYSVSVKTEDGQEIRKGLKLRRAKGAPAPSVDEIISGEKTQHPKFDDASLIQEDAAGAVGEASNGSAPAATSDPRGDKIDRAVAFKGAVEIFAHQLADQSFTTEQLVAKVAEVTDALLPIVKGEAPGNAQAPVEQPAQDFDATGPPIDNGIPF